MLGILQQAFSTAVASAAPPQVAASHKPPTPGGSGGGGDHETLGQRIVDQIKRSWGLGAMPVEIVRDRTQRQSQGKSLVQGLKDSHEAALQAKAMGGSYWKTLLFGGPRRSAEGAAMHQEDEAQKQYPNTWRMNPLAALKAQKKWTEMNDISGGRAVVEGASSAASSAETAAGSVAMTGGVVGALGAVAAGAIAAGAAFGLAVGATMKMTNAQLANAQSLSKYNASIAGALKVMEFQDIRRQVAAGAMTEGSYTELISAIEALKEAWLPLSAAIDNGLNSFLTALINVATPVVEGMSNLAKALGWVKPISNRKKFASPFAHDIGAAARAARDRDLPKRKRSP